jgi:hypothetical protein
LKPTQNTVLVRVMMMGKDAENWAGNYGTRFKSENLSLKYSG